MEELKCPICGEPTRVYMGNARKDRLCGKHADLLKAGKLTKCENCEQYYETGTQHKCNNKSFVARVVDKIQETVKGPEDYECCVCGKSCDKKMQCKDCYHETRDYMSSLNKNRTVREFRDYYYNLKDSIFLMKGIENTKKNCNKLIAIATVNYNSNGDSSLKDRVIDDVQKLIAAKKEPQEPRFVEETKEKDEKKEKIYTSQDGHQLKSEMEVIIDDVLYNSYILHCYEKNITEIREKRKKCDWFVPICNGEGIYIEYWGMTTEKYLQDRKEKEDLYNKYKIPYIGIEKDDPKMDTQTFQNELKRKLEKIAIENFGFMPKWKP